MKQQPKTPAKDVKSKTPVQDAIKKPKIAGSANAGTER